MPRLGAKKEIAIMTLRLEFQRTPDAIPAKELLKIGVLRRLIKGGRTPLLLFRDQEEEAIIAACIIPAGVLKTGEIEHAQVLELSIKDATRVAGKVAQISHKP